MLAAEYDDIGKPHQVHQYVREYKYSPFLWERRPGIFLSERYPPDGRTTVRAKPGTGVREV